MSKYSSDSDSSRRNERYRKRKGSDKTRGRGASQSTSPSPPKRRSPSKSSPEPQHRNSKQSLNTEEQLMEKLQKAIRAAQSADNQLRQQGLLAGTPVRPEDTERADESHPFLVQDGWTRGVGCHLKHT
uniref:(California timema) hypothetical protein n=1 Tax=Timema californicum TaxID=61474 RepID=A0A7R9P4W3_TIMCA|nr:unnamed protein product [Timema californicum]